MFRIDVDYPVVTEIIGAMNNSTSSNNSEKECRSCGEVKPLNSFGIHPGFADGHRNQCKACVRLRNIENGHMARGYERFKQWVKDNPERNKEAKKIWAAKNPDRIRAKAQKWKLNHPEYAARRRELARQRYAANREQICAEVCAWSKANRQKINRRVRPWSKNKRATDLNYKLKCNLRTRLYLVMKGVRKSATTMKLVGCSIENLWIHLESQFETGMTRENYGKIWEVDHIVPCALFSLEKPEHQRACFHFSNLQPLFVEDNLRKGAKHKEKVL
jgi:hypothetical protein